MNAVALMAPRIAADAIRRLAALPVSRFERGRAVKSASVDVAVEAVQRRWGHELCGLLNAMTRDELAELASELRLSASTSAAAHELRMQVWEHGAAFERAGLQVSTMIQPRPVVLGGHLVVCAPPRGMAPPATHYPRSVPAAVPPTLLADEPDSIDELLAAADRAIGVRLGARGRDKGAWGMRAAQLLGVVERGHDEPDWRGDVEIKTVPVERDDAGLWSVTEDPAIAMLGEGAVAKLQRTLWLARATLDTDGDADATIVSWYLLDWDAEVSRLARRYLHTRPKGPRNTKQRGLYLHKRFFAECGLLATLNGAA